MGKKFKAKYVVIPVLILAVLGGSICASKAKMESDHSVMVAKVSDLKSDMALSVISYYGGSEFTGTLKKGSIQNIKLNDELTIDEVLVKKGDSVKKGDKLFTYDLNSLQIALAEAENALKTCNNNITLANNELNVLKKLQPSENAPKTAEPEEPDEPQMPDMPETPDTPSPAMEFKYEKTITEKSIPMGGTGTAEDPFTYYVGEDTVVKDKALLMLCPDKGDTLFALFVICDKTGSPIYARNVDGSKIDRDNVKDWKVNDGVKTDSTGNITFDGGSANFASFTVSSLPQTAVPNMEGMEGMEGMAGLEGLEGLEGFGEMPAEIPQQQPADTANTQAPSDEITEKDNYIFSKEELKKMISAKEKELEKLNLDKRQNELDVSRAKKTLEVGAEVAELDGKVTFVAKSIKQLSSSGAYMTITSNTGMNISSTIGEFSLSKIEKGTKIKIQDYDNGKTYTGEVTFISDTPTVSDDASVQNSNESMYEFVVNVTSDINISENEKVSMDILRDNEEDILCLDSLFVRDEGSKHYVMVANKDNIIEKRYVKIGKSMFTSTEVLEGLSPEDRIANAYGKTKEGMKAIDGEADEILYGAMGSMFM